MTLQEINERLTKAQDKLNKKENLLKKYEARAEKKAAQIVARGWSIEAGKYQKHGADGSMDSDEAHDCYWTFCEYNDILDAIKNTKEAIEDQKRIVAKWTDAEVKAKALEKVISNEYPELFKTYRDNLVAAWTDYDMSEQKTMIERYNQMGYREFYKKYRYRDLHTTEEEFRKANTRTADALLLNLWNRVKEKVGTPTDYSGLHVTNGNSYEGIAINGSVAGTDGRAWIESIVAGGYNIQRLHIRVLVK